MAECFAQAFMPDFENSDRTGHTVEPCVLM